MRPGLHLGISVLGVPLLLAACADPMCACPPVDTSASAYLLGTVVDSASAPVVGASVEPTGTVGFDCSFDDYSAYALEPALTDSAGGFEVLVSVFAGPGTHCVEFLVADTTMGWSDSVFTAPIVFRHVSEPADTVAVILELPR